MNRRPFLLTTLFASLLLAAGGCEQGNEAVVEEPAVVDIDPGSIELPLAFNSLWISQTNVDYTSSGTESYWSVQVVYGDETKLSDIPVAGAEVTVEFRGILGDTLVGTTDAGGWATWTRPKGQGAEEMYVLGVYGVDLSWNSLDAAFWTDNPALWVTGDTPVSH